MSYSVPFEVPELTYEESLHELHATLKFGIQPMLETVVDMIEECGNPDLCYDCLQVAGTNGKTSTSRYSAAILAGEGLSTALYTSPELVSYTERMEVDGKPVSEEAFAHGLSAAIEAGRRVNERRCAAGERPYDITEFDLLTVAALVVYAEAGIDVAVLDQAIDVNFISYMEYSGDAENKFHYCRVDAELDSLTDKDADDAALLDDEKLTALVREASGKDDLAVEVKPLANEAIPMMLIEDEQSRRFNDMGRIYGRSEFTMPEKYSVVLNSRNATVRKLSEREKDERSVLLTRQLCDLAELSRQPLTAERMTEFLRRSMEIVNLAAGEAEAPAEKTEA